MAAEREVVDAILSALELPEARRREAVERLLRVYATYLMAKTCRDMRERAVEVSDFLVPPH